MSTQHDPAIDVATAVRASRPREVPQTEAAHESRSHSGDTTYRPYNSNGSHRPFKERPARTDRKSRPSVALVIPAKNEAANISWVLEQIPSCVDEVILVDGHSTDATLVTARSCRPDVHVVHQQGTGKGDALRVGFLAAEADIVVMIDADCSMSPQEIPHYVHFLADGYDFVKGSRFMAGGGSHDITRLRRLGNRAFVYLVNALYEEQLTDLCYGFCAFHRRYLPFLDLSSSGFEVETQLTLSAMRAGLRLAEVPSLEMPRRHGRSNLRTFPDGVRVLRAILRGHRRGVSGHAIQGLRTLVHGTVRRGRAPGHPISVGADADAEPSVSFDMSLS